MNIAIVGIILIMLNVLISYRGFRNHSFLDKYKFEVDKILINKEYIRFFSSGFLHADWMHLLFNMISLLFFSESLELLIGPVYFLILYAASLLGGNLLALFVHRHHGDYSAVGASGAVSGIIFASITLFPGMQLGLILVPIMIPAWLFGLLYIAYTIYGIKSKRDNIGQEAHLGGALIGMLIAIAIFPESLIQNYIPILCVFVPSAIFIALIVTKPHMLFIDNLYFKQHSRNYTIEDRYNEQKVNNQKELDSLLDKIGRKGMNGLSAKEKQRLQELSRKIK